MHRNYGDFIGGLIGAVLWLARVAVWTAGIAIVVAIILGIALIVRCSR